MEENVDLACYNTFGISVMSRYLQTVSNVHDVRRALHWARQGDLEILILGCGSNMLLTRDWEGVTLVNRIKGIDVVKEDVGSYYVKVGGGEIWHEFVTHCVEMDMGGVENLALIPGTVGAAPVQNIGAYGAELADVYVSLEAVDTETGDIKVFNKRECGFGYRDSVFKRELKGKVCIISVTLKLEKVHEYKTTPTHEAIAFELDKMVSVDLKSVSDAVIKIRQSKLPDPNKIGNAGSFFKNPIISRSKFEILKNVHPGIVGYRVSAGVQLAAGWLIDEAGWKGIRHHNCGVHDRQTLVLVNYGGATGGDILNLATDIAADVMEKFGVHLEREVNVV